jgi:hypothetical protein
VKGWVVEIYSRDSTLKKCKVLAFPKASAKSNGGYDYNILLEDVLCMNLRLGGQGGFISEEQQKHRSICGNKKLNEKLKNDENFKNNFKKSVSEGLRKAYEKGVRLKKINENYSWVGKKHKPQTIEKFKQIRADLKSQSGNKNSQFGTCWITNGLENKKIIKGDVIPKGWFLGRKIK